MDELSQLAEEVDAMRHSVIARMSGERKAWETNSELITAISHDIRTPMTALIGYLDLLNEDNFRDPERSARFASSAYQKAMELKDLTDELFRYFLVFGRAQVEMNREELDGRLLLEQLLGEAQFDLSETGFVIQRQDFEGECSINGLSSTQFFVKDLLDTLGVDIQLIRHGKFKSAGEMYIRNDISPENRLQYEELLGSIWGSFLEEIASSRGISENDLRSWIDGLQLATAEDMLEKGLVDGLKHRDEMAKYLCHMFGVKEASDVRKISISEYASDLEKGPSSKKIAVLYADGEIVRSGSGIAGEKFSKEIAKVRADSTVKAVVFRVNSPGGEVVAAEMIRREIELLMKDKPVVASYGGYAASGGYLISAACKKIFTDNSTLTGSIGVFGMVPSLGRAMRKTFHVNPVTIGTNEHSTMGSGMKPLSKEEQAWYQEKIEGIYDSFVSTVAEGRSMTKEAVDSLAQGRVWSGKDALENGLADERGTLMDAVRYAADLAGLKKYRIETYPVKKEMSESLMEMLSGKETKKDDDLVKSFVKSYFAPGFHTIARMPEIKINNK